MSLNSSLTLIKFLAFQNPERENKTSPSFKFLLLYSSLLINSCFFFILLPILIVQFYRSKLPQFPIIVRIVVVSRTVPGIVT